MSSKQERTPSESEWLIMDVIWEKGESMTSAEVIRILSDRSDMTGKMIRVLMNRLVQKNLLSYTVDEHDSRVYHYSALRSREECQREKSKNFLENYFGGSLTGGVASLIQSADLSEAEWKELEKMLSQMGRDETK